MRSTEGGDGRREGAGERGPGGSRVWLLRHSEVHADWQGVAYGGLDVPLSEGGLAESARLARAFATEPLERVLCSPLRRARELGERLAREARVELVLEPGLVEIDRGRWQGLRVDELVATRAEEVEAFYADPWSWKGHGGECDADVLARARGALERASARDGTVALVSHYNVIRVLVAHALGVPPPLSFRFRVDTGGATLLERGPEGWRLRRSNVRGPCGAPEPSAP